MDEMVSIIIPVYKVEEYLDECIESVIRQSYENLEIILVDDGSPDACPQMCDTWAERDARIKVIHKTNGGLSSARNAGLDICTGEYIAFVDSDDWIKPNMIARMLEVIERENADMCACNIISCYPNREVAWGGKNYRVGNAETMLKLLYHDAEFPVSAVNKLYKRRLWEGFRFPEGKICEDAFTTYLLLHNSKRVVQITDALYCYRIRPESIMTAAFSARSMDEEEAWRKNYEFVKENYPTLYREAFSFYLQGVNVLLHRIKKEQREQFREEFDYLRKKMGENLLFMLLVSTTSLKYRAKYLLDFIRL